MQTQSAAGPAAGVATTLTVLAVALSLGGAAIHLAAAPGHIEELGFLGWGFLAAAAFQIAWPLGYAVRPSRAMWLIGVGGNAAILVAWSWSRTVGLPVGPFAGRPEAIGVPDVASVIFEVLVIALLLVRAAPVSDRIVDSVRRASSVAVIASVPAIGAIFLATALAATLALSHDHTPAEDHGHLKGTGPHGDP